MKKNTIKITTLAAALLSLLWIFGFAWSIQDFYYGKSDKVEETVNVDKNKGAEHFKIPFRSLHSETPLQEVPAMFPEKDTWVS